MAGCGFPHWHSFGKQWKPYVFRVRKHISIRMGWCHSCHIVSSARWKIGSTLFFTTWFNHILKTLTDNKSITSREKSQMLMTKVLGTILYTKDMSFQWIVHEDQVLWFWYSDGTSFFQLESHPLLLLPGCQFVQAVLFRFCLLLYVLVNSYGHVRTYNHTFILGKLNQAVNLTFACNWQKPFLNQPKGREWP